MLEIDEGSRLGRESLAGGIRYSAVKIPADDAIAGFYESACVRLATAGYEHYEISNWALPGRRSRHNLKYWRREPYLGFGAGAHSFDGTTRWANVHDSARYVSCVEQGISPREQIERVTPEHALEEEFFLGLRQLEGIDLAQIESAYGESQHDRVADLRGRITALRSQGFVELEGARLRLAPDRLTVSNEVFVELLG
jgi:oxygen-independent coproporphyrinogen III oxidase